MQEVMKKTAVVTDSNAGILPEEAAEKQIFVLPMPFMIDGKDYLEHVDLTEEAFYQMMKEHKSISTSQPAPGDVLGLWDKVLEEYEELVRQIDASLCFTMITMAGIVINAVVVGLFIFAQPRYMIYGMGLFYTACCMIAWDLYACWRKGILYKF